MSRYNLPKLHRYIPLWQRTVPKYPLYSKGDPRLKSFLSLFWMKIIRPKYEAPPSHVKFEVHPQMTAMDIQEYLTRIYGVAVDNVHVEIVKGETERDPEARAQKKILKPQTFEQEHRFAYVQLAKGQTFEFPEIIKEDQSASSLESATKKELDKASKDFTKSWSRHDIPSWFS